MRLKLVCLQMPSDTHKLHCCPGDRLSQASRDSQAPGINLTAPSSDTVKSCGPTPPLLVRSGSPTNLAALGMSPTKHMEAEIKYN